MPNYSLVVNSQFKPFSYQELALPLDRQEAYHEKIAEAYEELSNKADILEAMGSNDRDVKSGVYNRYKSFSDRLRQEADNLYRNGLNTESRQRLTDLRRMYNTDIVPIQNAWNKREEEAKQQQQAKLSNPYLMFTRDARNTSLNEYVANPLGGYGVINGANIAKQMADMCSNLEKQVREGINPGFDEKTYSYIYQYGLSPDTIKDWRNNPVLSRMFEQVMQSNGVTPEMLASSTNARDILDQSTALAESGMWNAIGKSEFREDFKRREDYKFNLDLKKAGLSAGNPEQYGMDYDMFDLPMSGADNNNVKEQEGALQNLGYVKNDKGNWTVNGKVKINTSNNENEIKSSTTGISFPRVPHNKEFNLYDKNGNILSRENFVKQATSDIERKNLIAYYENKVKPALSTLGMEGTPHNSSITSSYNNLIKNNASQYLTVYPLHYESGDWNDTAKNYTAKEITGYRNGKPIYGNSTSIGNLLNKKDGEGKLSVAAYWSNQDGQEGVVISTKEDGKDKRYFISIEGMPSENIRIANNNFKAAAIHTQLGDTQKAAACNEAGIRALHSALTLHNKGEEQSINRQLPQSKSGY